MTTTHAARSSIKNVNLGQVSVHALTFMLAESANFDHQLYSPETPAGARRRSEPLPSTHVCIAALASSLTTARIQDKLPSHVTVQRISFSEITRPAVERALAAPRAVDQRLVEAYIARISADYLLGFSVSPMLWKKLPGAKSAGRVQSVALRLVCDREAQRDMHESVKFYTATAHLDGKPHCKQVCVSLPAARQRS